METIMLASASRRDFLLIGESPNQQEVRICALSELGEELVLDIEYSRIPSLIQELQQAYEKARPKGGE